MKDSTSKVQYICSLHFKEEFIRTHENRSTVHRDAFPTENLPGLDLIEVLDIDEEEYDELANQCTEPSTSNADLIESDHVGIVYEEDMNNDATNDLSNIEEEAMVIDLDDSLHESNDSTSNSDSTDTADEIDDEEQVIFLLKNKINVKLKLLLFKFIILLYFLFPF